MEVEIIKLTSEVYPVDYQIISGGINYDMSWQDWQDMFIDEYKIYWETLKSKLIKENLVGKTGEWQDKLLFHFSDGKKIGFSWRGWGDFMSALIGKNEGYMKYYMD